MKRMMIILSGIAIAAYVLVTGLSAASAQDFSTPGGTHSVVADDKGPTSPIAH